MIVSSPGTHVLLSQRGLGGRILVPRPRWLRGTDGSGDENELLIKTLTHINNLSSFITHVEGRASTKSTCYFFFLQDGIPRMVANGENLTVSTDLFTKLYTEPKCH